jgi:hypothetical protein
MPLRVVLTALMHKLLVPALRLLPSQLLRLPHQIIGESEKQRAGSARCAVNVRSTNYLFCLDPHMLTIDQHCSLHIASPNHDVTTAEQKWQR